MTERMQIAHELLKMLGCPSIGGRTWDHAITLKVNTPLPLPEGEVLIKGFHARIDSKLLGRNWARKRAVERTFFVFIPEYGVSCSDLHYHGLISWPPVHRHRVNPALIEACWVNVAERGTVHLADIADVEGWARYCVTEKGNGSNRVLTRHVTEFISSSMFLAKHE